MGTNYLHGPYCAEYDDAMMWPTTGWLSRCERKKRKRVRDDTYTTAIQSGHLSQRADKCKTVLSFSKKHILFSQGDTADAVFYIQVGRVKVTVVSEHGKEAVIAILEQGAFVGESCLVGQTIRTATATALEEACILRIEKAVMLRMLQENLRFAEAFMSLSTVTFDPSPRRFGGSTV